MSMASLAQLAEHALRKRMVMGSIPIGGSLCQLDLLAENFCGQGWRLQPSLRSITFIEY